VLLYSVACLGLNIQFGYAGVMNFAGASFFGIGAYVTTLALVYWDLTPWLGIPLGMIVGGAAAILIGMPTFRLRGHYFALSMLAYPLAILYVLQYLGFQEVSLPMHRENPAAYLEFTDPRLYTVVAVGLLIAGIVACMLVENSRFGLALLAIRQNELAAEAAGIDSWRWKMRALVVSGMLAAAAGGFYARVRLVVTPDSVNMLSEACAVGCPVHTFVLGSLPDKLERFHRSLRDVGLLHSLDATDTPPVPPLRITAAIAATLRDLIVLRQSESR